MSSSDFEAPEEQRVTVVVSILLFFSYFVLPGPAYIAFLTFVIAVIPSLKSHTISILTIFYFSFLIASRYSGDIWGGSDDLPSYFLAYDAISSGEKGAIDASFYYAKHLDIGFIGLTKLVNYISDGNRFVYYFAVVYLSLFTYYVFLCKALKGRYALFALVLFLLYFKNIHLSMHILRSSLAIPIILLALACSSYVRYVVFFLAGTVQASSTVLASLTLVSREFIDRFSLIQKITVTILTFAIFFFIGDVYLFGKITHAKLSVGLGNYPVILCNVVIGIAFIVTSNRRLMNEQGNVRWIYLYGYFILVSLLSLAFSQHTYRFSQFVLYLTPFIMALSISEGRKFDYLQYIFALIYIAGAYFTYYYIVDLNESSFYYRNSGDAFINGFSQLLLFFDYLDMDVDYYKFWRLKNG